MIYRSIFPCLLIIPANTTTEPPLKRSWVSNAYRCKTLIERSPYLDSSISEIHTKYGFVSEQYSGLVVQHQPEACPLETYLGVVSRQRNVECWSLGHHVSSIKTLSDCMCRNSYTKGILQAILQGISHKKALTSRLHDNNLVFTLSFDPLTTTTMPMPDISVSSKQFPHPCNSALGYHKNTYHMPLERTSVKHLYTWRQDVTKPYLLLALS